MAVELKLNITETVVEGEINTYQMTMKVVNAVDIDPEIFIIERTCPTLNKKLVEETFHHVAYLPEMTSIKTTVNNSTHQYIRKSSVTRTYASLDRMNESKRVMLSDINMLVKTANQLGEVKKETEVIINSDGCTSTVINNSVYTFDGEIINF